MTDPAEETYFDTQYQTTSLVFGLVMVNLLANTGMSLYMPEVFINGMYWNKTRNWWTR